VIVVLQWHRAGAALTKGQFGGIWNRKENNQ
jgi:hypothetical protein